MKILVVDDDESILRLCETALARAGHSVTTAPTGEAAAARLTEGWDLILSDVVMPGSVDGLSLLRRSHAEGNADVILMAGNPHLDQTISALREGAYDFLVKPFPIASLVGAVQRCDQKRKLSHDLARERELRLKLDGAYAELARMKKVQETFGQFTTPEVAQFVMEHPPDFLRFGQHAQVSVLFADVRGFTPFAGRVTPDEAVLSLNEVLSYVIAAVQRERGIVNKFIGDGMMAIFGAPVPLADHAEAAARAALWAREAVETLAKMRQEWKLEFLRLGFGVNTGEVVAGCLGNRERAEYSVFGHSVNLAARLEEAAGAGQILVGPGTAEILSGKFSLGTPVPKSLPGLAAPVPVSELLGKFGEKGA